MKHVWSDILVPAAIAGITLASTLGVETTRIMDTAPLLRLSAHVQQDTLTGRDTLRDDDDFDFFADDLPAEEDTTPRMTARDTMKVPDSLRLTDPFLYRWYVAVKDSLTHRVVVDSLKAAGDSVDWLRIDSLYLADSAAAYAAWYAAWYAGLSKAERKRVDYEKKLPLLLHKQDSIFRVKDSLQHIKDSIRENTPRILDTPFLPDSLQYKRLVVWKHNRWFNTLEPYVLDTTAQYQFYDFPYLREDVGGTFLGLSGSAVQTFDFFRRDDRSSVSFYAPYESWTYSASSLPLYNTKTPYTELQYDGNLLNSESKASDNVRVFTTQNITPALNFALEYKSHGGAGILQNEKTRNTTAFATVNYLGKNYLAQGGVIYNSVKRAENGGIIDNMWIRDTTVDAREIAVSLTSAQNAYRKRTLFFDQSWRFPLSFIQQLQHRGDTTWVPPQDEDMTTAFLGTATEITDYTKMYTDAVSSATAAGDAFYHGEYFLHPGKSADSLRALRWDNRVFLRMQPWHEEALLSKVEGGLGYRHQRYFLLQPQDYLLRQKAHTWNSAYLYGGAEGKLQRYLAWDAFASYTFAGTEVNDLDLRGNATLNLYPFRRQPDSPVTLHASFEQTLREPGFYEQHFSSNHYRWENDFSKVSTTQIQAGIDIPKWRMSLSGGYALLANNIYYDSLAVVRQNTTPMSVLTARLNQEVRIGRLLHLDHRLLLQYSSDEEVLPLPLVAANLRYYIEFPIVSEQVLKMQIGVNTHYTTEWHMPGFNPVAGVFYNQREELYGNRPRFDVFANMQWKQACIFLKFENAGNGWPFDRKDYFSAHHYIHTTRAFKVGIYWPFYPPLGDNRKLSTRAGSGMGGGGGSGLGGGLRGAMSGMGR